jgi:hypothetical protein
MINFTGVVYIKFFYRENNLEGAHTFHVPHNEALQTNELHVEPLQRSDIRVYY